MPIQLFDFYEYFAPAVVFSIFFVVVYFLCLIINYTLILDNDDATKFERFGSKRNFKFGRRPLESVNYHMNKYQEFRND
uniref:Movement protein n=1 Tax=Parastrongyloides trichosuri TaxID=131310 RepID=A0A0N4ZYD4_PARTI